MTRSADISRELQEISPELVNISLLMPYSVPAGYFESLAELTLLRIKAEQAMSVAEETEIISPLLAGIRKEMPYSVPEGYFEKVPGKMVFPQQQPAKVISLQPRRVFRYAVAAVLAGIFALAAWFYVKEPAGSEMSYAANEKVSETKVIDHIDSLSETEIAAFLEAGSVVYTIDNPAGSGEIAEADVQLLLSDVPDSELERYLQMNNPDKEQFN